MSVYICVSCILGEMQGNETVLINGAKNISRKHYE